MRASTNALTKADRDWLLTHTQELLDDYIELDVPLGVGHIHGNARLGPPNNWMPSPTPTATT
ncbi:hypothetical protein [Actinosynnema mirum]|uniref:hypothetical protein n=1 Tax=Actinosynnema mirum TaxID=40567 RepID=UPI000321D652|nr:hypothetical protein [Actinosynnema mirum]